MPTRARNVSCVALRLPQRAEVWLFDCGEGTQHQLLRSDVKTGQISRIFITHLHGDHLFGLVGLLATCGMAGAARRINIYGPPGLSDYVRDVARYSETRFADQVEVHTVEAGEVCADEEFIVTCAPLAHRVPSFGYRVSERDKPGHFAVEKASAAGIPAGPLFGRLKRGELITLPDGREFDGRDFTGPDIKGRSVVYCTDTTYCRSAVALAQDADLLIHEATFAAPDEDLARRSRHSTAAMAARVAAAAQVRQLFITHISPRYIPGSEIAPEDLLREARALFPPTEMAHDFLTVEVARREPVSEG